MKVARGKWVGTGWENTNPIKGIESFYRYNFIGFLEFKNPIKGIERKYYKLCTCEAANRLNPIKGIERKLNTPNQKLHVIANPIKGIESWRQVLY